MKKFLILFLLTPFISFSQLIVVKDVQTKIPSVILENIEGKKVKTDTLNKKGNIVISFWATWCSPCKKELNNINEVYEDWVNETGIKVITISIDDQKTKNSVKTYVNGKGWDFEVLLDPNGDFKRMMGVNNVPHTFLIDNQGNIVYNHNNYVPGDEEILYEKIKELTFSSFKKN